MEFCFGGTCVYGNGRVRLGESEHFRIFGSFAFQMVWHSNDTTISKTPLIKAWSCLIPKTARYNPCFIFLCDKHATTFCKVLKISVDRVQSHLKFSNFWNLCNFSALQKVLLPSQFKQKMGFTNPYFEFKFGVFLSGCIVAAVTNYMLWTWSPVAKKRRKGWRFHIVYHHVTGAPFSSQKNYKRLWIWTLGWSLPGKNVTK